MGFRRSRLQKQRAGAYTKGVEIDYRHPGSGAPACKGSDGQGVDIDRPAQQAAGLRLLPGLVQHALPGVHEAL